MGAPATASTSASTPYGLVIDAADTADSAAVSVSAADLQGPGVVFCPNPRMALWNAHPRVFIDVASTGQGKCPYCGTVYRLAPGALADLAGHGH